jgi:hypothetical protein
MRTITPKKGEPLMTVNSNMPDFNKTEFARKKAERARAFIAKHGLPKDERGRKGKLHSPYFHLHVYPCNQ